MPIFEIESWLVVEGKEQEHEQAMRQWLQWVKDHRELFQEWKSVRYFVKYVAGNESGRHVVMWEYESLTAFEQYKQKKSELRGPVRGVQEQRSLLQGRFHPRSDDDGVLAGSPARFVDRVVGADGSARKT